MWTLVPVRYVFEEKMFIEVASFLALVEKENILLRFVVDTPWVLTIPTHFSGCQLLLNTLEPHQVNSGQISEDANIFILAPEKIDFVGVSPESNTMAPITSNDREWQANKIGTCSIPTNDIERSKNLHWSFVQLCDKAIAQENTVEHKIRNENTCNEHNNKTAIINMSKPGVTSLNMIIPDQQQSHGQISTVIGSKLISRPMESGMRVGPERNRRHYCMWCHVSYARKKDLKRHLRVHDPNTPGCTICGKKFARLSYLQDHIRTHTGEKPFQCDTCGKPFSCKRNLYQHLKV
ncbi:zinc finger protein [Reticulomyxa filosa]|uniref:Zinc finger protein n=1 Tax=Reticulomyxa filosa TaxID=46433 RepID=X6NCM3_RETFI|nr:zinc finger protein [Reticulomyxa filosa]|eukprot:ETO23736.1 zinc finger protein [Reticulomyxa filosa]